MNKTIQLVKTVYIAFFLDNYCDECSVVRNHKVFWNEEDAYDAISDWEDKDPTNGFAYGEVVSVDLDLGSVEFNLKDLSILNAVSSPDFVDEVD